jgi:hypothetical protein
MGVSTLYEHCSRVREDQAVHQSKQRRLACTAATHEREHFTGFDGEREMVEDLCRVRLAVRDVTKLDGRRHVSVSSSHGRSATCESEVSLTVLQFASSSVFMTRPEAPHCFLSNAHNVTLPLTPGVLS